MRAVIGDTVKSDIIVQYSKIYKELESSGFGLKEIRLLRVEIYAKD
jgi:uncharacterized protein (UPF0335 family)